MADYDVVVVGAGPAGLAAAYHLLDRNLSVCVLERGGRPGEKNVMGGVMYLDYYRRVFPHLPLPPYEREVEAEEHFFITSKAVARVGVRRFTRETEAVTLFRAQFDPFLADMVEKRGGVILTDVLVKKVIDGGDLVRILTDKGEITGRFVVGADGVNSVVASSAGIREKFPPDSLFVSIKEVIRLSPDLIDRRFDLEGRKGAVIDIIGHPDYNLPGGGFIYTNHDTISVGTGAKASFLIRHGISVVDLLQSMKEHPFIRRFVEGGETLEISTHLIPYGDVPVFNAVFARGRVFLVGDAMGSTTGDLSGLPVAFLSGMSVAEAIVDPRVLSDPNRVYRRYLRKNGLLKILRATRIYHLLFRKRESVEKYISRFLFGVAYMVNSVGETGVLEELKEIISESPDGKVAKGDRERIQQLLDRRETENFISLSDPERCSRCEGVCLDMCPGAVYVEEKGTLKIRDYRCLECGFCRYFCPYDNIKWSYPPGGRGVIYKYG